MNLLQSLSPLFGITLFAAIIIIGLLIWSSTSEYSRFRGVFTYSLHLSILLVGWLFGRLLGIILISLPLLFFYYYFLIHVALAVVPTSNAPRSWQERFMRARYFLSYVWGFQYPAWVVDGTTGRNAVTKIKGDQSRPWAGPGFVWANSHQVVGLTTGINFSRAEIPGTVFTRTNERPIVGVVDLRTQKRTLWIDVVSSDGIPYKACLSASFAVDKDKWGPELYFRLINEDPSLKDAREPDYTAGSFPFSRRRIRILLSSTGIRSSTIKKIIESETIKKASESTTAKKPLELEKNKEVSGTEATKKNSAKATKQASKSEKTDKSPDSEITFWDEIVLYHVEKAASEVLSQRRFDEIWLPANDYQGVGAPAEIAKAIIKSCSSFLRRQGINLLSCGLVDFQFEREKVIKTGQVERQQIAAWQADWQRDTLETRARGNAEAELLRQEARAYAYATLLTAVADSLQGTGGLNAALPRNLIALRFIGALEEMLHRQPDEDKDKDKDEKNEASLALRKWKLRLLPDSKRE